MIFLDAQSLSQFKDTSVLFVPNLVPSSFCLEARQFILENEGVIIDRYKPDGRGLVCESVNGQCFIKYFEHPFHFDSLFFGRFLSSSLLGAASFLLEDEVRFVSAEIHSRFPGGSLIPPHQDNAYYGLENGKGVTFYISLDPQSPSDGGLEYVHNPSHNEYDHINSLSPGFSLEITDKSILTGRERLLPQYSPGDCTIHHSRSIHLASVVPAHVHRSFAFRFSFYSVSSIVNSGHAERYSNAVRVNRSLSA